MTNLQISQKSRFRNGIHFQAIREKICRKISIFHTLVTPYMVIFNSFISRESDENELGRSSLHLINRNALSFQVWRKLN